MPVPRIRAIVGALVLGMLVGCSQARRAPNPELQPIFDSIRSEVCLGEIRERFPDFKPKTLEVITPTFGQSGLYLFNQKSEPSATCSYKDGQVDTLTFTPKGGPGQTWKSNKPRDVR